MSYPKKDGCGKRQRPSGLFSRDACHDCIALINPGVYWFLLVFSYGSSWTLVTTATSSLWRHWTPVARGTTSLWPQCIQASYWLWHVTCPAPTASFWESTSSPLIGWCSWSASPTSAASSQLRGSPTCIEISGHAPCHGGSHSTTNHNSGTNHASAPFTSGERWLTAVNQIIPASFCLFHNIIYFTFFHLSKLDNAWSGMLYFADCRTPSLVSILFIFCFLDAILPVFQANLFLLEFFFFHFFKKPVCLNDSVLWLCSIDGWPSYTARTLVQ